MKLGIVGLPYFHISIILDKHSYRSFFETFLSYISMHFHIVSWQFGAELVR